MKVEMKLKDRADPPSEENEERGLQPFVQEAAIDIAQVLAANQALLKNIARKMETLENKLHSLECACERQQKALEMSFPQRLMLMAPPREVKPWMPDLPALDEDYFAGFSFIDRLFHPERMRRKNTD